MEKQPISVSKQLERQYSELFKKSNPLIDAVMEDSLEQPYVDMIVETVTTYSVYEEPIIQR